MKATGPEESKEIAQAAKQNAPAKQDTIGGLIEKLKPQLERALPKHVTVDRIARIAITAIRNNQRLQQSEPITLMAGVMLSAQLGLELNTPLGQCYLIPYKNGKTGRYEAQFQMGYKGLIDLAHRSGQYQSISAYVVDEADDFYFEYGLEPQLTHIPARSPSGKKNYYYAVYRLKNGGKDFRVWSKEQVEAHMKQYSKSYSNKDSAWSTAFDTMACKTVLIDLLRYAPKSVEQNGLSDALSLDSTINRLNVDDPDLTIDTEYAVEGGE